MTCWFFESFILISHSVCKKPLLQRPVIKWSLWDAPWLTLAPPPLISYPCDSGCGAWQLCPPNLTCLRAGPPWTGKRRASALCCSLLLDTLHLSRSSIYRECSRGCLHWAASKVHLLPVRKEGWFQGVPFQGMSVDLRKSGCSLGDINFWVTWLVSLGSNKSLKTLIITFGQVCA